MNSNYLKNFIKKLIENPKLTQGFKDAADKSTDEAYKFALKHSEGHFGKKDFEDYMVNLTKECSNLESKKLNDKSLTNISGGIMPEGFSNDEDLKEKINAWEKTLSYDNEKSKSRIKWLEKSGILAKLASTISNIGFSIYKLRQDKKNEIDDSEEIKISELKEMIAIKKLEDELKKYGIDDYESLID